MAANFSPACRWTAGPNACKATARRSATRQRSRADHSRGRRQQTGAPDAVDARPPKRPCNESPVQPWPKCCGLNVAIVQQRAKRRLPKSVYSSPIAASEKGITVADNVAAFAPRRTSRGDR